MFTDAGNRIKNPWFDQWAWEHEQGMKMHILKETYIPTKIVISHFSVFFFSYYTNTSKQEHMMWMEHGPWEQDRKGKSTRTGDVARHVRNAVLALHTWVLRWHEVLSGTIQIDSSDAGIFQSTKCAKVQKRFKKVNLSMLCSPRVLHGSPTLGALGISDDPPITMIQNGDAQMAKPCVYMCIYNMYVSSMYA